MSESVSQLLNSSDNCKLQFRLRLWTRRRRCPLTVVYSKAHWETESKNKFVTKHWGLNSLTKQQNNDIKKDANLHERASLLAERVVVFELYCYSLVTIHSCKLYICGVVHMDGTKELGGSET